MAASNKSFIVTDTSFDSEVLSSNELKMVDFWADWCGPCKSLSVKLEGIAVERKSDIKLFTLNVEENPDIAKRFKIHGLPTVIFFRNGEVVDEIIGNQPREIFLEAIDRQASTN